MDLVKSFIPIHDRGAKNVFVAPEHEVFPKTDEIDHTTTLFIRDAEQLQSFLDEKSGRKDPNMPNARNGVITRLFSNAKVKLSALEIDLGKAVFTPNLSRNLEAFDQYVIYENGISSSQFGELFQLFMATPAHRRPCVLLISNKNGSRLIEKLAYSRDAIEFVDLSKDVDRVINVKRCAPNEADDYLDLYTRGVYHVAVRSQLSDLLDRHEASENPIRHLASQVLQFQARLMTEERHHVLSDIDELLKELEEGPIGIPDEQKNDWLRLQFYLLLQKTYCSEQKEPLESAMAISSVLGDKFDNALCQRFAHFLDQESRLEQHMLRNAEQTFRESDCLELALYAANNLRVYAFSSDNQINETFEELCSEIHERIPALHRRYDIVYNMGVEALFDHQ